MMKNKELCPICGEGHVTHVLDQEPATYKGQTKMLPLSHLQCDTCTSDFAGLEESRANKRAMLAFRKQVDGLLAGAEVKALRERYKINQTQAAKLFGGGPVAFSKYENDDVVQSEAMDKLLRLVRKDESTFWNLVDECGMTEELSPKSRMVSEAQVVSSMDNVIWDVFLPSKTVPSRSYVTTSDESPVELKYGNS